MPDLDQKLTQADPIDIADSIGFALMFSGKKRIHDSDRLMAAITAKHIVAHLDKCGYVVLKRPPLTGSSPLNPPASWPHTKAEDVSDPQH
jgi:hypothetical protein